MAWYDFTPILMLLRDSTYTFEDQAREAGFKVNRVEGNSKATFTSMWTTDGIVAFVLVGHGTEGQFPMVNVDLGGATSVGPWDVRPPYHLAMVHILACGSANASVNRFAARGDNTLWAWSDWVSADGHFIGFSGNVNVFNLPWQIETDEDR
jgi:hypothetical protein